MRDTKWMDRAACRGVDPELFFPSGPERDTVRTALEVCGQCPVRGECRMYADEIGTGYGCWGGTLRTVKEQRAIPTPRVHGSEAGAKQHWRRGEPLCDPCQRANRLARVERLARRGK